MSRIDHELLVKVEAGPIDQEKQNKIDLVLELRQKGLSFQKIADYMNAKEIPTLSGRGTWKQGAVGKILTKAGID